MPDKAKGLYRYVALVLDKASARQAEREMAEALARAGEVGGQNFSKELRKEYEKALSDARVKLGQGLIDQKTFDRLKREADETFNRKLGGALAKLRADGKLTDDSFNSLSKRLKKVGDDGQAQAGRIRSAFSALGKWIVGLFAVREVWGFLRDSVSAAQDLEGANRRLAATAKITGTDLDYLKYVAALAGDQFKLSAGMATDFAIEVAKLAAKAGDVGKAVPALGAFLDLGAARGLSAEKTLEAVRQAILGIDEGTDKLFGKNPSVIYAEFAKEIGTTAAALTDTQKAQALLNAALEDGGKVRGEFQKWLESSAGQSFLLGQETLKLKQHLGQALQPALASIIPVLSMLVGWFGKMLAGWEMIGARLPVVTAKIRLGLLAIDSFMRPTRAGIDRILMDDLKKEIVLLEKAADEVVAEIQSRYSLGAVLPVAPPPTPPPTPARPTPPAKPAKPAAAATKTASERWPLSRGPAIGMTGNAGVGALSSGPDFTTSLEAGVAAATQRMQEMQTVGQYVAGNLEGAFTDLATSMIAGFGGSGEAMRNLGDVAQGVGAQIVAGLVGGMASVEEAKAAADLAEGFWPPNPAAWAAAAKHLVAAGLFRAVEGWASGRARSAMHGPSGGGGAAPVGATNVGGSIAQKASAKGPDINVYLDGVDPSNPRHQDLVGEASREYAERYGGQIVYKGKKP